MHTIIRSIFADFYFSLENKPKQNESSRPSTQELSELLWMFRIRWRCALVKWNSKASCFHSATSTLWCPNDASSVLRDGTASIHSTLVIWPSASACCTTISRQTPRCPGKTCAICSVKSCTVVTLRMTGIADFVGLTWKNTWILLWSVAVFLTLYLRKLLYCLLDFQARRLSFLVLSFLKFLFGYLR